MSNQLNEYIDLCRKGDARAFGYIVEEYQKMVYTLSFRLLCDKSEAEDITQDTFIRVWLNIGKYDKEYKFSTWVYKIAANLCYDRLRRNPKISKVNIEDCKLISDTNQENRFNDSELKIIIIKITEGLTPKQKLVFTLSELEELEVSQISVITGLSHAKIKSNLYLARKYIKTKISNYEQSRF